MPSVSQVTAGCSDLVAPLLLNEIRPQSRATAEALAKRRVALPANRPHLMTSFKFWVHF